MTIKIFNKNKKGYFFSLDAFIALLIILGVIFFIKPSSTHVTQEMNLQNDLLVALSSVTIGEINNSYVEGLISQGKITNFNQTVLEQIGEFYARSDQEANLLAKAILDDLDVDKNIGLYFNNMQIATFNSTSLNEAEDVWTSRQIISGIRQGNSSKGYSSRAFLFAKNKVDYFYFGGYVGDGDISIKLGENVSGVTGEAVFSGDFEIYINDVFTESHSPLEGVPYEFNLTSYLGLFNEEENYLKFKADTGNLYIAGGFVKITYNEIESLSSDTKFYLPGIDGIINFYDSFYVPGNLTSMEIFLHYNSPYDIFMMVGNKKVYSGDSGGFNTSVTLSDTNLSGFLNYDSMDYKTIPIRIGLENVSYLSNISLFADVFSVTDLSGSMDDDCSPYTCEYNCGACSGGCKICDAKEANGVLINGMLNITQNRIGLVGYETIARDSDFHALSNDNESLIAVVEDEWDADGNTCICCGINYAKTKFFPSTTSTNITSRYILYINFDNNVLDQTGNGNSGTIHGNPVYNVLGVNGSALDFDGNDYVSIPDSPELSGGAGKKLTVTAWINADSLGGTKANPVPVVMKYYDFSNKDWGLGIVNNKLFFAAERSGNNWDTSFGLLSSSDLIAGRWSHVAFTLDGRDVKLYIDGALNASTTLTFDTLNTGDDVEIGRDDFRGDYFRGLIDEVRIYDEALSASEIQSLVNSNPVCNNGVVEAGELCDMGGDVCQSGGEYGVFVCDSSCGSYGLCNTTAVCGDGRVNSGENCDDGNIENHDGCSDSCQLENRFRTMIVMSDGEANIRCSEQGTGTARGDAIEAACDAFNDYGISVYTVGFGTGVDETTLQGMASCGHGNYYYGDVEDIVDIYGQVTQDIIKALYSEQTVLDVGEGISTILYPDSYVYVDYQSSIPYGLVITTETEKFGNNISEGIFTIPNDTTPYEAKVVSYSGPKWTDNVNVLNSSGYWENIFSLSSYNLSYVNLGDPYVINIPQDKILQGANSVRVSTGLNFYNSSGGSEYNKVIYSVLKDVSAFSPIVSIAEGCTWTIEFEDGTNIILPIPSDYTGSASCSYVPGNIAYNPNDAISNAIYYLLSDLDLDSNGRIETKFSENDLTIDSSEISGIPFTWETEVQVRVWK